MAGPSIYEKHVIINSRDVDGNGFCKASALLGYLQDASAEHSSVCGCGRDRMVEQFNVFWMLVKVCFRLNRPIRWLDHLTVRTWHHGSKSVLLNRDYDLIVNGEVIGEAVSVWVLPDLQTRAMLNTRKVKIEGLEIPEDSSILKTWQPRSLRRKDGCELVERRRMRYSDSDVNGHVNNTRYADFACDAIQEEMRGNYIAELDITYHKECMPGEILQIFCLSEDHTRHVHGADEENTPRFDARLRLMKE